MTISALADALGEFRKNFQNKLKRKNFPEKEHLEVIGYKNAFKYVISIADKDVEFSERVIKDIHSLVLMEDAGNRGAYRNIPVRILGALHTLPQPYLV